MKDYQNIIEEYEQYLAGKLDEGARLEIEDAIANDKEVAEFLEGHKLMLDGIRYSARKNLQKKLIEWDAEMQGISDQEGKEPKVRKLRWYHIAASVALFAFSITFVYQFKANTYPRIASRHYDQYEQPFSYTRGEIADENQKTIMFQQYEFGQFDAMIETSKELDEADLSEALEFQLACAYMATENFDDAMQIYEDLAQTSDSYRVDAKWYLGLGHLYKKDPDRAIPLFKEVASNTSSKYSEKANDILQDLN